jgi:apolipoprotein D and lipocalin family protein
MQLALTVVLALVALPTSLAHCWSLWGCDNGEYESRWSWNCQCEAGWEGQCCEICEAQLDIQTDVDLDEWTRATWYIQEQQVTGYQPEESLYCVTATYERGTDAWVPLFHGEVIEVYNQANQGAVNGPLQNDDDQTLCARLQDESEPGKLSVAPCFLPNILSGPYWIIAIGKDESGKYDWAVVIGGEPTEKFPDGCTTTTTGINGAGLWLFSRTPVASEDVLASMKAALAAQGVATSQLRQVAQAGCNYNGAFIKS